MSAKVDHLLSRLERLPPALVYFPLVVQWLWLALRHRSLTLPTIANPAIEAGGLCGESKSDILAAFGPKAACWVAPYTTITTAPTFDGKRDLTASLNAMADIGLGFPIVAKPDIGCHGDGVAPIPDRAALIRYLAAFPRGAGVILQKLIPHDGEAGIFYIRRPGETCGRIFSLTLKFFPFVVGDGRTTLETLIRRDPRAGQIAAIYLKRHSAQRRSVLLAGERFPLVFTGNHCKGAVFRDGHQHITPALTERFDAIARDIPEFYFGRFDVRFASLADLERGENFDIIEVNGAGSEATHVWDRDIGLIEAYLTLLEQFRILFEIGHRNRSRGYQPLGLRALITCYRRQTRLSAAYPPRL